MGDRFPRIEHQHSVEIHRAGEWSGLYVDGELVRHGDHYLADEALHEMFDVAIVDDDAWLRGGNGVEPDGPAQTLGEVRRYADARGERQRLAAELEDRAAALAEQARQLRESS